MGRDARHQQVEHTHSNLLAGFAADDFDDSLPSLSFAV